MVLKNKDGGLLRLFNKDKLMVREVSSKSYIEQLLRHREQWERKPCVRVLYNYWYKKIYAELSLAVPTVEIGCGCGNFKEFVPSVIATDCFVTPWASCVVDACRMSFGDNSIGNIVAIDVLHHIKTPVRFFYEASRVLTVGGRIIIIEPYTNSLWGRLIWQFLHHEHVEMAADFFNIHNEQGRPESSDYSNGATGFLLFWKHWDMLRLRVPALALKKRELFSFFSYPLTGGFQKFSLIPSFMVQPLSRLEDTLFHSIHATVTGLRVLIVMEKITV